MMLSLISYVEKSSFQNAFKMRNLGVSHFGIFYNFGKAQENDQNKNMYPSVMEIPAARCT